MYNLPFSIYPEQSLKEKSDQMENATKQHLQEKVRIRICVLNFDVTVMEYFKQMNDHRSNFTQLKQLRK